MIKNNFPVILAEKRLRVADVVRATGMSKSTLHKLYNDESSRIDFNTINQLCEFLDVQVGDYLFMSQTLSKLIKERYLMRIKRGELVNFY